MARGWPGTREPYLSTGRAHPSTRGLDHDRQGPGCDLVLACKPSVRGIHDEQWSEGLRSWGKRAFQAREGLRPPQTANLCLTEAVSTGREPQCWASREAQPHWPWRWHLTDGKQPGTATVQQRKSTGQAVTVTGTQAAPVSCQEAEGEASVCPELGGVLLWKLHTHPRRAERATGIYRASGGGVGNRRNQFLSQGSKQFHTTQKH